MTASREVRPKATGGKARLSGARASSSRRLGGQTRGGRARRRPLAGLWRLVRRVLLVAVVCVVAAVWLLRVVDPPGSAYMAREAQRLGVIDHTWVALDRIAPVVRRSIVAAEDANFCAHYGFDLNALRAAIDSGGARGASTITQQTVKNLFLWHDRSYVRKLAEAALTPVVEATWTKARILEVYLNIAEFGAGVFGIEAAAWHYFGVSASRLTAAQAARLAVVLPAPKTRDPRTLTASQGRRAAQVRDGAVVIARDGRAACLSYGTAGPKNGV
ncbi:MAG: monofunctional biosynthetic peptidoglycan transglycosylase [Primorskyibacter sp.]